MNNYLSAGDFVDAYHLCRRNGIQALLKKINISERSRTVLKWDHAECSDSDFWLIPEVQKRWNEMCTGDKELGYEAYIYKKYLHGKHDLDMLSVGCGNSTHEQTFSVYPCFRSIEGIDLSEKQLSKARMYAALDNCKNLDYHLCDFETGKMKRDSYDLVLFHSSLHHFKSINQVISRRTLPLLRKGGLLVLFDYTGPNRLQWTKGQLSKANALLHWLPRKYRIRAGSRQVKKRIYRPGLWRMVLSDPSEAVDSESILPVLHNYFEVLEETRLACNLIHPLLKDISQNFMDGSAQSRKLLMELFQVEDNFVNYAGKSDFTFGVYRRNR
jgi:SAM-dependent methyltransferase